MDISVITLILTSFTALAAVIGPIISSVINVRSNERTKRFEQYSPQIYASVHRFTEAYASFPRWVNYESANEYGRSDLSMKANSAYKEFSAASYEVIFFIPNAEIRDQITSLLAELEGIKWTSAEDDAKFQAITSALATELAAEVSQKKKRIGRKAKRTASK